MLKTNLKSLKKLVALSAVASMCGFAKAEEKEFTPAGEITDMQMVNGTLMVNSKGAQIAGQDTPYTFMPTNRLESGFAPSVLSNATSVVSDTNGTCFATTKDGKVFRFKVGEHGIPSIPTQMAFKVVEDSKTNDLNKVVTLAATKDGNVFGTYDNRFSRFVIEDTNLVENTSVRCGDVVQKVDADKEYAYTYATGGHLRRIHLDTMSPTGNKNGPETTPFSFVGTQNDFYWGDNKGNVKGSPRVSGKVNFSRLYGQVYATGDQSTEVVGISTNNSFSLTGVGKGITKVLDNPKQKNILYFATTNSVGRTTR